MGLVIPALLGRQSPGSRAHVPALAWPKRAPTDLHRRFPMRLPRPNFWEDGLLNSRQPRSSIEPTFIGLLPFAPSVCETEPVRCATDNPTTRRLWLLVDYPWGLLAFVAIAAPVRLRRVRAGILRSHGSQGEPSSVYDGHPELERGRRPFVCLLMCHCATL